MMPLGAGRGQTSGSGRRALLELLNAPLVRTVSHVSRVH